jgi:hypothetical protein
MSVGLVDLAVRGQIGAAQYWREAFAVRMQGRMTGRRIKSGEFFARVADQ